MDDARVRVQLDADGKIVGLDVEGHPEPEGVTETVSAATTPHVADDEYKSQPRTWFGA